MSYGLNEVWFWLWSLGFISTFFLSCYVPGAFFVRRYRLPALPHLLLATVLGIILWGAQGFIFGYLGVRALSYLYVLGFFLLSLPTLSGEWLIFAKLARSLRHLNHAQIAALFLMTFGGAIQLLQVAGSGLKYPMGVAFFRVNAFDGMLHLSFIRSIMRQFPPQQPGALGLPITNYHYWSDLVMAELSRVWGIPVAHSFFQFWPVILTLFTGLAAYYIVRLWSGHRLTGVISLFFLYFGADTGYLITLALHRRVNFDLAAIDNGATQFLNMPHSFAKLIFLTALIPLTKWLQTKDHRWGILTVALLAPLVGFKVYFGMFAALGFSLVCAGWLLKSLWHRSRQYSLPNALLQTIKAEAVVMGLLVTFALIALGIFLPPNQHAGGLFWAPLEWPKLLLSLDQLNFRDWWLRKQVYEAAGSWKGILAMDALAIIICLIAVYGTRILGFLPHRGWYRRVPMEIVLFMVPGLFLFTFLGMYTLQDSGPGLFNVFNFFAVACVPLSLLSSFWIADWLSSRHLWLKVGAVLILALTLPRIGQFAWVALHDQVIFHYDKIYPTAELEALDFIHSQTPPHSVVQSHPHNFLDFSTPYVSYFSDRPTFLTGVLVLQTHNQPIESRQAELEFIFDAKTSLDFSNQLRSHGIDYVYLLKKDDQKLDFEVEESNLQTVFENDTALVLQPK